MQTLKRKIKIAILGNSIPLMMLPHRNRLTDRTYVEILADNGFCLINASKQSAIVSDVFRYLDDEVIRHFPDYIIIHMGIVEATMRARSRAMQSFFNENAWKNNIINIEYCSEKLRLIRKICKHLYKPIERILYFSRISWRWMSPRKFEHALNDITFTLLRDTSVKNIIFIGIFPADIQLEKMAPGTSRSVEVFNQILDKVSSSNQKSTFLNINSLLDKHAIKELSIDSMHFTALGHSIIAEKIESIITNTNNENRD